MTAQEYLTELKRLLYPLSDDERKEAVAFYYESIADRIDEGLTEEEAVASMVAPTEAACAILSNRTETLPTTVSKTEAVAEKTSNLAQPSFWTRLKHGHLTPFEWVGVVFSSVIWLPLAISVAAIFFSLYLCIWALIACIWIIGTALVVAAPASIVLILLGVQIGNIPYALVNAGYGLVAFGGGMWILRGGLLTTKWFLRGHYKVACALKKTPYTPKTPTLATERSGAATFFMICLILIGAGFASVLAGYAFSGFNWQVFLTSINWDGTLYVGGTQIDDPKRFFFTYSLSSFPNAQPALIL